MQSYGSFYKISRKLFHLLPPISKISITEEQKSDHLGTRHNKSLSRPFRKRTLPVERMGKNPGRLHELSPGDIIFHYRRRESKSKIAYRVDDANSMGNCVSIREQREKREREQLLPIAPGKCASPGSVLTLALIDIGSSTLALELLMYLYPAR